MKNRAVIDYLKHKSTTKFGRIIVLTGARQTGKTTLIRAGFKDYAYISLEDPITRPDYAALSAEQWQARYPVVILDEIQKVPSIVESVKAVYDRFQEARFMLLGSSQILLMEKIRESLAGRVSLVELYPLTFPEMLTTSWQDSVVESRMIQWLKNHDNNKLSEGIPLQNKQYAETSILMEKYLQFGAMPAIVDDDLDDEEKFDWLHDYIQTYLQRDIRDLANLRELEPFVRAQKALAGLTGECINISNIVRQAGISSKTAKRFLTYLEISYQVILLKPWFRNAKKRLVKSPKVHFLDPGIQRGILRRRGQITGAEYESAIVAEIYKQIKNSRLPLECYHLRTVDGLEVDLVLESEDWFVPIEIKMTNKAAPADVRHLRKLGDILDRPILHSFVISNDPRIQKMADDITAIPASWFLGSG